MLKVTISKCDCCGKKYPSNELSVTIVPQKEFDGVACAECEKELKSL